MAGARILWRTQLILGWGFFLATSLGAQDVKFCDEYPEVKKYQYRLEGNDGFKYHIIQTEQSIPCYLETGRALIMFPLLDPMDASPMYEGWRTSAGGEQVRVTISLAKLYAQSRLKDMPRLELAKGRRRLGLFVGNEALQSVLKEVQSSSDLYFEGSQGAKAKLAQEVLFGDQISLDFETLRELGRRSANPNPAPISFEFPVLKYRGSGFVVEDRVFFQVNQIRLKVLSRSIRFDPKRDRISVRLESDRVSLSGPIRNHVDAAPLITNLSFQLPTQDPFLEEGRVDYIRIDFDLRLERTAEDLWSMALDPGSFVFSFNPVDEEEGDPRFYYNATYELPDGSRKRFDPADFIPFQDPLPPDEEPFKVVDKNEIDVQSKLAEIFDSSITQRFFAQSLQFGLPFLNQMKAPVSFQLADWDIRSNGLYVYYDFKGQGQQAEASCVGNQPELESSTEFDLGDLNSETPSKSSPWTLTWDRETLGYWNLEADKKEPEIELIASVGGMNALVYELWREGAFCWSTADWPSRPSQLPLIELAALKAPQLTAMEDSLGFNMEAQLRLFQRNFSETNEEFEFKQSLEFFSDWSLQWSSVSEEEQRLLFQQSRFGLIGSEDSEESEELREQSEILISQAQRLMSEFIHQGEDGRLVVLEEKLTSVLRELLQDPDLEFRSWGWNPQTPDLVKFQVALDLDKGLRELISKRKPVASSESEAEESAHRIQVLSPSAHAVVHEPTLKLHYRVEGVNEEETSARYRVAYRESSFQAFAWHEWRPITPATEGELSLSLTQKGFYRVELQSHSSPVERLDFFYDGPSLEPEVVNLQTVLLSERPPYDYYESRVRFAWGLKTASNQRVLFSYSLEWQDESSESSEPAWSSFTDETEKEFILTKPGRYRFRVKAMTTDFELEKGPGLEVLFFYKGNPLRGEGAGIQSAEDEWLEAQRPSASTSNEPSQVQEVQPANSRGPFGCQLQASSSHPLFFVLIFFALSVGLLPRCRS